MTKSQTLLCKVSSLRGVTGVENDYGKCHKKVRTYYSDSLTFNLEKRRLQFFFLGIFFFFNNFFSQDFGPIDRIIIRMMYVRHFISCELKYYCPQC